ncbi:MAG: 5-methylcytosine restriction system component-like [Prolixibacteraceae bacterium]|nr:MAG: 5-methylcytosine restriction system component-like [Prolixibacteraceae bacterium]
MSKAKEHITVFEHEILRHDKGEKRITQDQLKALQNYYGEGIPYYSLCHNGVQFNEFVGAIQIGNTPIEVLPKADKNQKTVDEENKWRNILIDMLRAVGSFDLKTPSHSNLKIKPNNILDLYFELFIKEIEYLYHSGLVKQYRKAESNLTALKGSLQFTRHLQINLTHQERFYVRHTIYDVEHKIHFIIYKTLRLLKQININASLHSRIGNLLLNFPEMPDIKVSENTFNKIIYNRKTQAYSKALEISRLILLQYHPDLSKGRDHVLALMFDMNKLWEQFVYVSLRKQKADAVSITAQTSKYFWKPVNGSRTTIRPDIVINKDQENCIVLDTKWKNLNGKNPSPEDLRQMYVYHEYFGAKKVALVYPGDETNKIGGIYIDPFTNKETTMECNVITIAVESAIKKWQIQIGKDFNKLIQFPLK